MLDRWNRVKSRSRSTRKKPATTSYDPAISWPHVRDSLLLLAAEVGIDIGFRYAEQHLPVTPGLMREPRRVLHWFMVATICWFCADPLLRLLNNTRRGLIGSGEQLISMGIEQGDRDEEHQKPSP